VLNASQRLQNVPSARRSLGGLGAERGRAEPACPKSCARTDPGGPAPREHRVSALSGPCPVQRLLPTPHGGPSGAGGGPGDDARADRDGSAGRLDLLGQRRTAFPFRNAAALPVVQRRRGAQERKAARLRPCHGLREHGVRVWRRLPPRNQYGTFSVWHGLRQPPTPRLHERFASLLASGSKSPLMRSDAAGVSRAR
jgi:hypothetical protein